MSIDASRWAWTQQINPSQKIVLLSLADRADEDGYCYPSIKRLELDCSMTRRTIQRNLAELEALNLIERKSRFTGNGQTSNDFFLIGIVDRHGETKPQGDRAGRRKPIKSSVSSDTPPAPPVTPRTIKQTSFNHQKKQQPAPEKTHEHHEQIRKESLKAIVERKKPELLSEFKQRGFVVTKTWGTVLEPDLKQAGLFD